MGLKYDKGILAKKTIRELKSLADDNGIDVEELPNTQKTTLINALLEIEESELEEDEAEFDDIEEDEVEEAPAPKAKKTSTPRVAAKSDTLSAKEVAAEVGTDSKKLRQFFRSGKSSVEPVGAGGRYEFNESDVPQIKADYEAWAANKPGRGAPSGSTGARRGRKPKVEAEVIEEVEEIEELEFEGLDDLEEEEAEIEEADLEIEEED